MKLFGTPSINLVPSRCVRLQQPSFSRERVAMVRAMGAVVLKHLEPIRLKEGEQMLPFSPLDFQYIENSLTIGEGNI